VDSNSSVRLILASQSPRRVDMLRALGVEFETKPSEIDESSDLKDPAEVVQFLAQAKAQEVARQLKGTTPERRTIVLGADTIVVLGSEILGKPSSREDAYQMLMRMSGRNHRVFTGVALVDAQSDEVVVNHAVSKVFFRALDSAEVRSYARTEEPMDKAGAYALQGAASVFVDKIEGCYSNIIGLPMPLTVRMLRQAGVKILGLP